MVLSDIELVKNGRIFSNTYLDWLVEEAERSESASITNGRGPGWMVDDAENTEDSGITSGKGSTWSVAGSEKTEDSAIGTPEDLDIIKCEASASQEPDRVGSAVEEKSLSSKRRRTALA